MNAQGQNTPLQGKISHFLHYFGVAAAYNDLHKQGSVIQIFCRGGPGQNIWAMN